MGAGVVVEEVEVVGAPAALAEVADGVVAAVAVGAAGPPAPAGDPAPVLEAGAVLEALVEA